MNLEECLFHDFGGQDQENHPVSLHMDGDLIASLLEHLNFKKNTQLSYIDN
jgi:hypothetical protein